MRGEASADHVPDRATLAVHVRESSPDSRVAALARASEVAADLRAALDGADGVRRVVLSRVSVHERWSWDPGAGTNQRAGWEATVGGTVEADAGAVPDLAETVAAAGAGIAGVSWELDDPAAARRAVRRAAVDAAREAATDLADAVGRPLGPLRELAAPGLSSAVTGGPEAMAVMARGSAGGGPALDLDPQDVTVRAVVEATYALEG
ncbi:SIMPL domain-containing protein [Geodermatophilus normandii]|uniref:SIMPL domain-containing protein n=1 Tax=Geodermatophilus normandii TaxID=1137989 RepID=UPI0014762218|nr:SIMPL domain-containing protein [Geodermatophilus normandii]